MTKFLPGLFVTLVLMLTPLVALAMIEGGKGNKKINDARLPAGAGAIINRTDRIAWWEGDGGPFHAEGRGNAKAMTEMLADLAKVDVKTKRVVVHDGVGQSYLINMDLSSEMKKAARIDWAFSVWPNGKWENSIQWRLFPNQRPAEKPDLPAQLDVYTANIRWADVVIPQGIEVIDEQLEAHGFTLADGIVLEGHVKAIPSGAPIVATVRVQRVDSKNESADPDLGSVKTNEAGAWVLKKLPAAWVKVVVEADGYVPRVVGYARFYDQPQWKSFDTQLVRNVSISGRVTDAAGAPLADVDVRLDDVAIESGGEYESPTDYKFKTDAEGRFKSDQVPAGKATVWLSKSGYSMGGLGQPVTLPASDVELHLIKAGSIRVTVDFEEQKRPKEYIVELEPEGGNKVGSYGGSAKIDEKNSYAFENVPPGKYVVKGHPNPAREQGFSDGVVVDLVGAKTANVTIKAR